MSSMYSPQPGPGTPATEKRAKKPLLKHKWVWAVGVLGVIVVAAAVSSGGSNSTSPAAISTSQATTSAKAPSSPAADTNPMSDGGWTASDVQVKKSQFGTSVSARVKNTEDTTRTGLFTLTVFSASGTRIGEFTGSAADVEAGSTATVTFVGTQDKLPGDPSTYTYAFQSDM